MMIMSVFLTDIRPPSEYSQAQAYSISSIFRKLKCPEVYSYEGSKEIVWIIVYFKGNDFLDPNLVLDLRERLKLIKEQWSYVNKKK